MFAGASAGMAGKQCALVICILARARRLGSLGTGLHRSRMTAMQGADGQAYSLVRLPHDTYWEAHGIVSTANSRTASGGEFKEREVCIRPI